MKITAVRAESYACRQPAAIVTGDNAYAEMNFSIVRVETDQGVNGFGLLYASNLPGGAETIRESERPRRRLPRQQVACVGFWQYCPRSVLRGRGLIKCR